MKKISYKPRAKKVEVWYDGRRQGVILYSDKGIPGWYFWSNTGKTTAPKRATWAEVKPDITGWLEQLSGVQTI